MQCCKDLEGLGKQKIKIRRQSSSWRKKKRKRRLSSDKVIRKNDKGHHGAEKVGVARKSTLKRSIRKLRKIGFRWKISLRSSWKWINKIRIGKETSRARNKSGRLVGNYSYSGVNISQSWKTSRKYASCKPSRVDWV